MIILITGTTGFVGRNIIRALSKEYTIYGISTKEEAISGVEQIFSWGDLSAEKPPNVDAIIHLAGKAHDTKNKSKADIYFEVNTELTKKIYDYFLTHNVSKFIYFSSVKAAADSVDGILTEDITPTPVGPYGESKIAAENYILSHPPQRGKSTYILRPCMIHGQGNKGNLNLLYNVVSKGIPWPLGAFENSRSFASIDNVCYVVSQLLTKDIESGIYNIADDEPLSTNQLIEIISKGCNKKARILNINKGFISLCAKLGSIIKFPLNSQTLGKLTESYVVSNKKIKSALGIERMPTSVSDGLEKTIRSFQDK